MLRSDPAAETVLAEGQPLVAGRYRVERLLGAGGTSEVWRALDERLERLVAIKLLRSHLAVGPILERVSREARAAAQLRHPAVVQIYDLGEHGSGMPLIVMEYLVGRSLRELLEKRGRLAPTDAVAMLLPVADALAAAHEQGVVHRDVKPENVFAARMARGLVQPKLLDFGVAQLSLPAERRLTSFGALVGTPAYMSPEQTAGLANIDGRSDVWSLGVTLFEAVAGELPFNGERMDQLVSAIHVAPLPFPRDVPGFDGQLFSIIAAATRKGASERVDMAELVRRLARWLGEHRVHADLSGRALASYEETVSGSVAASSESDLDSALGTRYAGSTR